MNSNIEIKDGKAYPIIWRKIGSKDGKTDPCPFCEKRHYHGKNEGHRVVHCPSTAPKSVFIAGIEIFRQYGYYLKEYKL